MCLVTYNHHNYILLHNYMARIFFNDFHSDVTLELALIEKGCLATIGNTN